MQSKYLSTDASLASSHLLLFPDAAVQRCGTTEKCALICFPLPETAEADGGMRDGTVTNTLQRLQGPSEFLGGETQACGP